MVEKTFLDQLLQEQTLVSLYLTNGVRLQGHIARHDASVILFAGKEEQVIYKQAIASILPMKV